MQYCIAIGMYVNPVIIDTMLLNNDAYAIPVIAVFLFVCIMACMGHQAVSHRVHSSGLPYSTMGSIPLLTSVHMKGRHS
jgi:hypothetical protein